MYDAWGGASSLSWAEAKINSIEKQKFAIQDEEERIISGALMLADTPIYRNDANGLMWFVNRTKKVLLMRLSPLADWYILPRHMVSLKIE